MRYLGGKHRQAAKIEQSVLSLKDNRTEYIEPFVGGGSVLAKVAPHFSKVLASDASVNLIALWKAIQDGWIPPAKLTRDEYERLRLSDIPSAMKGWAGYAASYNGKWFAGYGPKASDRDYLAESVRGIARKAKAIFAHGDLTFKCCDYSDHDVTSNSVVYCDPPYADTESYSATGDFDHGRFWETVRGWSERGALVLVHEYKSPDGWVPVMESTRVETMHYGGPSSGARKEILFIPG